MTRDRVDLDVPDRHVDSTFPSDWLAVRAGDTVVVIHEPGDHSTTAYTLGEPTRNPRVLAAADAVMWEGMIVHTAYHDGLVLLQHPHAGIQDRLVAAEWLDEAVPTLERTDLVQLRAVGGRVEFECVDCGEHVERERHQMDIPGMTPQRCTSCTFEKMGGRR